MPNKYWSATFLVAVLALLAAACGRGATPAATVAATTAASATQAPPTEAQAAIAPTSGPTTGGPIDCKGAKQGDTISMLYQWSGTDEAALNQVLRPLVQACGIVIKPESTRDPALLDTRVQAGSPPDI